MIKHRNYLRYHKLLEQGIRDTDLLEEMISEALEIAYKILHNSHEILNPSDGHECDCGGYAKWNDHNETWTCPYCGTTVSWHALYENEEMYTEQDGKLVNYIGHLEYAEGDARGAWFEAMLQFIHGSGPMARFFIEGGCRTLSEVTLAINIQDFVWGEYAKERLAEQA